MDFPSGFALRAWTNQPLRRHVPCLQLKSGMAWGTVPRIPNMSELWGCKSRRRLFPSRFPCRRRCFCAFRGRDPRPEVLIGAAVMEFGAAKRRREFPSRPIFLTPPLTVIYPCLTVIPPPYHSDRQKRIETNTNLTKELAGLVGESFLERYGQEFAITTLA